MPEHLACLPSFLLKKKNNQMVSTFSAYIGRATRSSRTGIPTTAGHTPQWDDASVRQAARSCSHAGMLRWRQFCRHQSKSGSAWHVARSPTRDFEQRLMHHTHRSYVQLTASTQSPLSRASTMSTLNGSLRTRDMVADPFNLVVSRTGEPSTSRTS